MKVINKILIANRGEIAVRIIRSCRVLGKTVGVIYSEDDRDSLATRLADEAYLLLGNTLNETYLNIDQIIDIAKTNKIDAIHPGYGFLSENASFAKACEKNNLTFIGPSSTVIEIMGDKVQSKKLAKKASVPILEPTIGTINKLTKQADSFDYPILIKAAAGGGGKGMRIVYQPKDLPDALKSTSREAKNYFGDERVFIEKYIQNPRHIEVQVLADQQGNAIALFERECSLQRRHQKIIEEAPSPSLTKAKREELIDLAFKLTQASNYTNAGTIEFLADENLNFFFLEMNTRVQVEHPVTEMITGIDIVNEQIKIAEGQKLHFSQDDISINGHAIEARVYAENPANNFYPSPGEIHYYKEPSNNKNIRVDAAYDKPGIVRDNFDPMISKVIAHGKNRKEAIAKLSESLHNYQIHGIKTNLSFLLTLLENNDFNKNKVNTHFIEQQLPSLITSSLKKKNIIPNEVVIGCYLIAQQQLHQPKSVWEKIGIWRIHHQQHLNLDEEQITVQDVNVSGSTLNFIIKEKRFDLSFNIRNEHEYEIYLNGKNYNTFVSKNKRNQYFIQIDGCSFTVESNRNLLTKNITKEKNHSSRTFDGNIEAPMPGKVIEVKVKQGETVEANSILLVLEAMKMENQIVAPIQGKIKELKVKKGDRVESGQQLLQIQLLKTHQTDNQKINDT